jgi:hypothetical protein
VRDEVSRHLERIAGYFTSPKITLIVRAPQLEDGDLILTDDNLDEAIAAILKLKGQEHGQKRAGAKSVRAPSS